MNEVTITRLSTNERAALRVEIICELGDAAVEIEPSDLAGADIGRVLKLVRNRIAAHWGEKTPHPEAEPVKLPEPEQPDKTPAQ